MAPSIQLSLQPHFLDNQYEYLNVLRLVDQNVILIELNRPRKRNAINKAMWKEIGSIFSRLGRIGDDCRAIVLTGKGSVFCAGIDISDPGFLPSKDDDNDDVVRNGLKFLPKIHEMQYCFTALERCPIPVIAAIHGPCIGAGIDLICCTDIRITSTDSIFSVKEVALGLAADIGTLQRLPKIIGNQSIVHELCLTARDFVASEALTYGLVSKICEPENLLYEAVRIGKSIARNSPIAVQGTKEALLYARDHTVEDGLRQIAQFNALALQGDDLSKAWKARVQRKQATFPPIPPHSKL